MERTISRIGTNSSGIALMHSGTKEYSWQPKIIVAIVDWTPKEDQFLIGRWEGQDVG